MSIRNLVENKTNLDYQALTASLIYDFGIDDAINWDAVIPAVEQKKLFGGETLRLFEDHPNFANQKDIRTIFLKKGNTSQLLVLFAKLKDNNLSKAKIERITKKFIGGLDAERYVVWFFGNAQNTEFKVVLSGKEGKKMVLKSLPFAVNQPYYKTYDFILYEVNKKVSQLFVEPNKLWEALWSAFDISVVNKKFYLDIKSAFDSLIQDQIFKGSIRIEEARKQFAVRLIGRLIFLWFLKRKGIIAESVLSSKAVNNYENYYVEFLEKLFFEVLNTPHEKRGRLPAEIKEYPFLNGGLFESLTGEYGDYQSKVFISNEWFFNLFNSTLERYNFTIDENTSSSSEIAIDPEMLGRIFENLLAEQNPESKESARKTTGSFYTPREIVDYMVEKSVSEFLVSTFTTQPHENFDQQYIDEVIKDFVHVEELPEQLIKYRKQILEKLNSIKVLDPACGSGAFPIAMLQKIVILKVVLSDTEDSQRDEFIYSLKLQTILNSIYGCDIQPMAVELSRLRCWLSLTINEVVDRKKQNWGIASLPNLDFKFVCVDTLIGLPVMIEDSFGTSSEDFKRLKNLRTEFFTASATQKALLEKDFKELQKIIAEKHKEWSTKNTAVVAMLVNWNPFNIERTDWFDPFWMFGVTDNFDVIIGNPPFVEHKKLTEFRARIKDLKYETQSGTADLYIYFYERSIKLLKQNGIFAFISSNKFFKTNYGSPLRDYLSKLQTIIIVDFTDYHVFDALVSSCIFILRKVKPIKNFTYVNIEEDFVNQNIYSYLMTKKEEYPQYLLKEKYWQFDSIEYFKLKSQIEYQGRQIGSIPSISVNRGVTTGRNEIFIISSILKDELIKHHQSASEIIKPLLQGRNIRKWIYEPSDQFLIFTRKGIKIEKYPSVLTYLSMFKPDLTPGEGRKKGDYEWYEIQDNTAYFVNFEKQKIIWGLTADKWAFAYDSSNHYLPSNGYILTSEEIKLKYILGVLNSSLMQFYFRFLGVMTAGGAFTLKHQTIKELPLKIPTLLEENTIANLVSYILFIKNNPLVFRELNRIENESLIEQKVQILEEVLDGCIYELYFAEEMKSKEIDILNLVSESVMNIDNIHLDTVKNVINEFLISLSGTGSKIRNRIFKFETRSPETILLIINSLK